MTTAEQASDERTLGRLEEGHRHLEAGQLELREALVETNRRMDSGFAELRQAITETNQRMDSGFAELRQAITETNQRMDSGFAELRQAITETNRRIDRLTMMGIGIAVTLLAATIGIAATLAIQLAN